ASRRPTAWSTPRRTRTSRRGSRPPSPPGARSPTARPRRDAATSPRPTGRGAMMHGAHGCGLLEVITGCMFSGKTEELQRRLRRARIARQRVAVFKPRIDVRYAAAELVSHAAERLDAIPVAHAADILLHVDDVDVVG